MTTLSDPLTDPWTPDQESCLLKALVLYPPKGLHAHFRMLSIRQSLLQSGTIDPEAAHTRIPGIWTKLRSLYDLEAIGEREDASITSLGDDGKARYWRDFELADGDEDGNAGHVDGRGFAARMWQRRLAPEGTPGSDWGDQEDNDETGDTLQAHQSTEEPRSSPVPSTVGRGMRSGKRGRVSKLKDEMEVDSPAPSGRGSRRMSKAVSEAEDADQVMEDAEDGEEADETEEGSSSEEIDDEDEKRTGGGPRRGRGGRRGRGRRGRRRG